MAQQGGTVSKPKDDPIKAAADSLREKKGVTYAMAKLERENEGEYVEYFRGRDLVRWYKDHPDQLAASLGARGAGKSTQQQTGDMMSALLRRGLVLRADRKFKRPKPGKKRLVKYPRTLERVDPQEWVEDSFYAWQYDRPTSLWYYAGIILLPIIVIAACLFPLAPWWFRMAVVYSLMGLLCVLLGLISVRYVIFGIVWILTGNSLWVLPNMMSDEVSVIDAFWPLVAYEKSQGRRQWIPRLTVALVAGFVLYVLYTHTPDTGRLAEEAKSAHDSILEFLNAKRQSQSLLNGTVSPPAVVQPPPAPGAAGGYGGYGGGAAGGYGGSTPPPSDGGKQRRARGGDL